MKTLFVVLALTTFFFFNTALVEVAVSETSLPTEEEHSQMLLDFHDLDFAAVKMYWTKVRDHYLAEASEPIDAEKSAAAAREKGHVVDTFALQTIFERYRAGARKKAANACAILSTLAVLDLDYDTAQEHLSQAVELDPRNIQYQKELAEMEEKK